jgi:hypothetical protein
MSGKLTDVSDESDGDLVTEVVQSWECNPAVCALDASLCRGTKLLLERLTQTKPSNCLNFYPDILDRCNVTNPARNYKLGHTLNCLHETGCQSLLRPARILLSHFLRRFIHE